MSGEIAALFAIGGITLIIGLIFAIIGVYFIAKWIAPGLGIDPSKAASVALVSSIANMLLWFILSIAILGG